MAAHILGRLLRTAYLLGEEKLLQDVGLERGTRFAGDNHQRLSQIRPRRTQPTPAPGQWSRRCATRETRLLPEGLGQNLRAQAGAAHAEQQNRFEVALRTSPPNSAIARGPSAGARQCRSSPSTSPRHRGSIALGSFFQKRSILLLACQSAAAASTAPRRSVGIASRKLITL
jgi:hypothetical protein